MSRVAITGIGMITPYGIGFNAFIDGIKSQRPTFSPITLCDTVGSSLKFAGQCTTLESAPLKIAKTKKLVTRKDHLALAAAHDAWIHAGLEESQFDPSRAGAFVGACSTQIGDFFPYFDRAIACVSEDRLHFDSSELGRVILHDVNPIAAIKVLSNGALAHLAQSYNLQGPNTNILNFGTAGLEALQQASQAIASGQADFCLAGAMYAPFDPFQIADGLNQSEWCIENIDPTRRIRPYSDEPSGTLPTESAVFLVLESFECAQTRSASILAEIKSWSQGSNSLCDDGSALQIALSRLPSQPKHVVGCGHGHRSIDKWEKTYLGESSNLHSIYGFYGYPGEASGLIQIAVALSRQSHNSLRTPQGFIPPDEDILISTMNRFGGAAIAVVGPHH